LIDTGNTSPFEYIYYGAGGGEMQEYTPNLLEDFTFRKKMPISIGLNL